MQSMDQIYQKFAQTVYRYLLSLTHNADLAEELTQETFYQAMKSIDKFDGSCKVSTWLCAIAKNQMYSYYRKHPQMDSLNVLIEESADTEQESSRHRQAIYRQSSASSARNVITESAETEALDSISHVELMKKLHNCPEPFREILYLRIFGNLSFKEIGDIVGKTENWARVTYYRGKERLRKEIERDGK